MGFLTALLEYPDCSFNLLTVILEYVDLLCVTEQRPLTDFYLQNSSIMLEITILCIMLKIIPA